MIQVMVIDDTENEVLSNVDMKLERYTAERMVSDIEKVIDSYIQYETWGEDA